MIEILDATARYDGKIQNMPVKNINLHLDGEKIVIIGPNGSGKTTILKMILGLAGVTSGSVKVFGKDVAEITKETRISTNLMEVYKLMGTDVLDTIRIYAELKGKHPDEALELVREFGLEDTLKKRLHQLSSGQQKIIGNILALSFSPSTVLLDEPFDNVDQGRRIKLVNIIERTDAEIILNTHELDILKRLKTWGLYFIIEGRLFGRFNASKADRLYLNSGEIAGCLTVVETSFGKYSITEDSGQVPLSSARDLLSVFDEVQ